MPHTIYNLHHQLIQFATYRTKYKDAPYKGTRYRLKFSQPARLKLAPPRPTLKLSSKTKSNEVLMFTLLPVQTSPTVTAARKAFLRALVATPFPCISTRSSRTRSRRTYCHRTCSRRTTTTTTTQPTTLTINHLSTPDNHPNHNLYQALIRYMDAFAPGVFGISDEYVYNSCSINKCVQCNWKSEKMDGNTAFTAVGTYTGGALLVEHETVTNALRQGGNLPSVSPKSYTASMLGIALRYIPSFTGYVVERMLPLSTRPVFCRLLREQSGVSAIRDDDLPRLALQKMCKAQQRTTAKQSSKNTKTKQTAVSLLRSLGIYAVLGYQYHLHTENSRMGQKLQYLLGGSIKSFEKQYYNNCIIHSLNNATYWYRKMHGLRQISAIELDLAADRCKAHAVPNIPNTLLDPRKVDGYYPFVQKYFISKMMKFKVSHTINTMKSFEKWLKYVKNKSFVALLINYKIIRSNRFIALHATSLRCKPNSNLWLYQDSNLPHSQCSIDGSKPNILWNFLQIRTGWVYGINTHLKLNECFFIWA